MEPGPIVYRGGAGPAGAANSRGGGLDLGKWNLGDDVEPGSMHPRYPLLFSPWSLRGIEMKNRGVGLFVVGATSPMPGSGWMENTSDAIVPRYAALAEAGRREGMRVFAQLCHPGFKPLPGPPVIGAPPRAPSCAVYGQREPAPRHVPSVEELAELVAAFGAAAARAVAGGVDGLELHAHESFLHAQFLTPLWNTRTDRYGGSVGNRLRFVVETLEAMRAAAGGLPLGIRLKCHDGEQAGLADDGFREIIERIGASGLVDYVNLTGGDGRYHHGPTPRTEGEWLGTVASARRVAGVPVLHAGRIVTAEQAEAALREGAVDAVCMTKAHICDPHHAAKAFDGRERSVRVCTRCLQSCHGAMDRMTCVYNPVTSREGEPGWATLIPAARAKRIVVAGGGPAGCEFARVAAARGHDVVLLERGDRLGGQVRIGASSPGRGPWLRIAEYYERNLDGVDIRLGAEATVETVAALGPELVVVATGSLLLLFCLPLHTNDDAAAADAACICQDTRCVL